MKFRTNYTRNNIPGEINRKPSVTQPDQSLSIPELLERFVTNRPVQVQDMQWHDDYIPDVKKMDLVERQETIQQLQNQIEQIKQNHNLKNKERLQKKEAEKQAQIEAERSEAQKQAQQKAD